MSGPTSDPNYNASGQSQSTPAINLTGASNGVSTPNGSEISPKKEAKSTGHIRIPQHLNRPHLTSNHRSLSDALRAVRSREEQETLLEDDEVADADGCLREDGGRLGPREVFFPDPHNELRVYYTIHR